VNSGDDVSVRVGRKNGRPAPNSGRLGKVGVGKQHLRFGISKKSFQSH